MKKILILLFLLFTTFSYADEIITDFKPKDLPVLNEELRQSRKELGLIQSDYFLSTRVKNSIVLNGSKLELSGDSSAPGNSQLYGTNGSGAKGWYAQPVDYNTSNVVFCYGAGAESGANFITYTAYTGFDPATARYYYWINNAGSGTYATIFATKFKKIAGISTVSIHCWIWNASGDSTTCQVNIGTANNAGSASANTPTYTTFDVDVSGLTNGTLYDVTIRIKRDAGGQSCISGIIGIAS